MIVQDAVAGSRMRPAGSRLIEAPEKGEPGLEEEHLKESMLVLMQTLSFVNLASEEVIGKAAPTMMYITGKDLGEERGTGSTSPRTSRRPCSQSTARRERRGTWSCGSMWRRRNSSSARAWR